MNFKNDYIVTEKKTFYCKIRVFSSLDISDEQTLYNVVYSSHQMKTTLL